LVSASDWGSEGRRFESSHPDSSLSRGFWAGFDIDQLDYDGLAQEHIDSKNISINEVVMRNPFFHGVGGVLSADIAVPDHEQELGFYAKVLTTGPAPLWRDDLTNNQGTPIIGLGARLPEYEALPLQWMPHFQVADVAASAASAVELGGKELMHGKDDNGQSQWAVIIDPNGAAFGVIPVVVDESNGAGRLDRKGSISWLSLIVSDVSSMCEFYEQVVGWSAASAANQGRWEMQRPDGVAVAEICSIDDDNAGIPCVWLLSLPVDDFDESLRQVRDCGGEVVGEASRAGRAVIRDPIGVYLMLQAYE
jgi:predicted enzyme related to lactoylglutathione lyase